METAMKIRRRILVDGESIRSVSRATGLSRATIRKSERKLAHFRLSYSRQPLIVAYPRETQEMLLDAYRQAFQFYQGLPRRVLIDNPKTMVKRIGKGKEQEFHPRFLAMMNHYLIEPVACTPASGGERASRKAGRLPSQNGLHT